MERGNPERQHLGCHALAKKGRPRRQFCRTGILRAGKRAPVHGSPEQLVARVGAKLYRFGPASLATWHSVDVSYSNMYFMGMVNSFLCASVPGLPNATRVTEAYAHGKLLLQEWLTYASSAGNHEFDSPTYYWVQMNALGLGCMSERRRHLLRPKASTTMCDILEHVWADVSANFFSPTETLSGPHSRDYDFLFGHGALQVLTYINGLGRSPPVCEFMDAHCERTDDGQNALTLLNAIPRVTDRARVTGLVPLHSHWQTSPRFESFALDGSASAGQQTMSRPRSVIATTTYARGFTPLAACRATTSPIRIRATFLPPRTSFGV